MLNRLKALKNNSGGYILIYVIMLMGFITILFAGTAMALQSRNAIADKTLSKQQLQVTAQSALKTIVGEFENNASLKLRLKEYAEGNQKADFELTDETGIKDDIEVAITKESEGKARITVTARNDDDSISTAFAIIDYTEAPKGDSVALVDNLIVAYMPDGMENAGSKVMASADNGTDNLLNNSFEGTVIVNNKNTTLVSKGTSFDNLIARGDVNSLNFTYGGATTEDGGAKGALASLDGKIRFGNSGQVDSNDLQYIYGAKGIWVDKTENFVWNAGSINFYTGDEGEVNLDSITGTLGNIYSGGKVTIKAKDNHPLTINGDVVTTKDIEIGEESPSNQRKATNKVIGSVIGGEDITLKGCLEVGGNISAVGNIKSAKGDDGNDASVFIVANNILAGRGVCFGSVYELTVSNILSGANFRKGDKDSQWSNYITKRNGIDFKITTKENKVPAIGNNIILTKGVDVDSSTIEVAKSKVVVAENGNSVFNGLNNTWRKDLYRVERGADSKGNINLAVALTDSEVAGSVFAEALVKAREGNTYFTNNNGYNVSHFDAFTYKEGTYVLNKEIKTVREKVNKAFRESIPLNENGADVVPEVIIPTNLALSYAKVEYDGSSVTVKSSGYMCVQGSQHGGNKIIAGDSVGNPLTIDLAKGSDICFNTGSKAAYDLLLGTKPLEELDPNNIQSDEITFAWNIVVDQPASDMGYVRIFSPENAKLNFFGGSVQNKNGGCIPEVYFMTNSNKSIEIGQGNGGYHLTGYIIAPHSYVNFNRATNDGFNKYFEGMILCGNVCMPYGDTHGRFVYYKPLTYESALTTDVIADKVIEGA